jgi:hypothetical protein
MVINTGYQSALIVGLAAQKFAEGAAGSGEAGRTVFCPSYSLKPVSSLALTYLVTR